MGDRVRPRAGCARGVTRPGLSLCSCTVAVFEPVQVVAPGRLDPYANEVQHLYGCSMIAEGEVVASEGKGQSVELLGKRIEPVGMVDDQDYPCRAARSVPPRASASACAPNAFSAMARVRHCLANAVHRYFHERIYWVHTPS